MNIGFVNSGESYLPEIKAYVDYINQQKGFKAMEVFDDQKEIIDKCDVVWRFMGFERKQANKSQQHIHEYSSLSVGSFSKQRNLLKKYLNIKPTARVFLNDDIMRAMNFNDNIPCLKRDMGVARNFYDLKEKKEYGFVYIGSLGPSRKVNNLLNHFKEKKNKQSILIIGAVPDEINNEYRNLDNIIFTGRINYEEVPALASKAIYGINYIPNIFPYNIQTSTKLLEYCALGLKIITTNYKWVNQFEIDRGASFFKLDNNLSNLNERDLEKFAFQTPNVMDLEWTSIFEDIDLMNYLNTLSKSN